jgi:hypothetical protein
MLGRLRTEGKAGLGAEAIRAASDGDRVAARMAEAGRGAYRDRQRDPHLQHRRVGEVVIA